MRKGFLLLSFLLLAFQAFAQTIDSLKLQDPFTWQMLDCVTAQGPFDKLLVFQKDKVEVLSKNNLSPSSPSSHSFEVFAEPEVIIDVIIDDKIKGTTVLPKLVFQEMQKVGEYLLKITLVGPDGTNRNTELKIFYGSFGVFHGVLKDLDVRTNDRIACDEP